MLELLGFGLMGDYVCGCDFVLYGVFCIYYCMEKKQNCRFLVLYTVFFSRKMIKSDCNIFQTNDLRQHMFPNMDCVYILVH
jgi:hypothetical protein